MMAGILIKGEMLKARRRFGVIAATLFFLALCILIFSQIVLLQNRRHPESAPSFSFPDVWKQLMGTIAPVSLFLTALVVMMLVASEFMWRTSRQNVIDGLSKNQWFSAKLLIALITCLVFGFILLGSGAAFAASQPFTTFMHGSDVRMLGSYFLALIGVASMAFFLAMVVRAEGGAVALFLVWTSLGEALLPLILDRIHKGWEKFGQYLPFRVFMALFSPANWNTAAQSRAKQVAVTLHRSRPETLDMTLFTVIAAGYILAFVAIAYADYQRRDL